jgi:hypothetical protein
MMQESNIKVIKPPAPIHLEITNFMALTNIRWNSEIAVLNLLIFRLKLMG